MIRNLPGMVAICGSIQAALFLDYALQQEGGLGGWFSRTLEEIESATSLSPQAQKTARRGLTERVLLEEKREGMPARTFFRVTWHILDDDWELWRRASNPRTLLIQGTPDKPVDHKATNGLGGKAYLSTIHHSLGEREFLTVGKLLELMGWTAYEGYKAVFAALGEGVAVFHGNDDGPTAVEQELELAAQVLRDAGLRPSLAAEALRLATPESEEVEPASEPEKPKKSAREKLDDSPVVLQIPVQGLRQYPVRQALLDQISRTFPGVDVNWYAERVRQYHNSAIAKRCTYDGVPARIRNFISKDIAEERVRMLPGKEWVADAKPEEVKLYEPRPVLFGTVLKASSDGKRWLAQQEWEREFPLVQLDWRE